IRGCSRRACLTRRRGWTRGRGLLSIEWNTKRSSINGPSHRARDHTLVCNAHVLISFFATEGAFELQEWLRNARVTKPRIVGHQQDDLWPGGAMFAFLHGMKALRPLE